MFDVIVDVVGWKILNREDDKRVCTCVSFSLQITVKVATAGNASLTVLKIGTLIPVSGMLQLTWNSASQMMQLVWGPGHFFQCAQLGVLPFSWDKNIASLIVF